MKVLITGGAGFIGSRIVDFLLDSGVETIVIDNLSSGGSNCSLDQVTFYNISINDPQLNQVFKSEKPDIVIHLAAQKSVKFSQENPLNDLKLNVLGTVNLLDCCVKNDVKKFIFSSSAAVYGSPQYLPMDEEHDLNPLSFYGLSKKVAENYIQHFSKAFNIPYTILRFSNVYGPKTEEEDPDVISIYLNNMLKGEPLTVYGDGEQTRDFIYIDDVAKASIAAVENGENEVINISSNQQTSINDLINIMKNYSEKELLIHYKSNKEGDIIHSTLSNKKGMGLLNWHPEYNLLEGMNILASSLDSEVQEKHR